MVGFIKYISLTVPNEERGPGFKTFPSSATVQEGESVEFKCEVDKTLKKGM